MKEIRQVRGMWFHRREKSQKQRSRSQNPLDLQFAEIIRRYLTEKSYLYLIHQAMHPNRRQELEERRRQLKLQQEATSFVTTYLHPYLEIMEYLNRHGVAFQLVELLYLTEEQQGPVANILQTDPYVDYSFPLSRPEQPSGLQDKLDQLFEQYPSVNAMRYVPFLPKFADCMAVYPGNERNGLQAAARSLNLSDQQVYLYYLRYSPIIELSLGDILKHDHQDLFNLQHGDAVIFPADLSWVIAFTLEEEWYAGKRSV